MNGSTAPEVGEIRWYVIHTLPRAEASAEFHLVRQGFQVFIPRIRSTRRHARRIESVAAPLFPRYGFVRLDLARHRWRSVNGTVGVASLVMGRELPRPVPVGIVEHLIEASDSDGFVDFDYGLTPGARVRLRSGPLAGQMGVLLRLDAKGRVEMLLSLISGAVRLSVARNLLEPIR